MCQALVSWWKMYSLAFWFNTSWQIRIRRHYLLHRPLLHRPHTYNVHTLATHYTHTQLDFIIDFFEMKITLYIVCVGKHPFCYVSSVALFHYIQHTLYIGATYVHTVVQSRRRFSKHNLVRVEIRLWELGHSYAWGADINGQPLPFYTFSNMLLKFEVTILI